MAKYKRQDKNIQGVFELLGIKEDSRRSKYFQVYKPKKPSKDLAWGSKSLVGETSGSRMRFSKKFKMEHIPIPFVENI